MGYNIFLPRWKVAQRSQVIEEEQSHGRGRSQSGPKASVARRTISRTGRITGRMLLSDASSEGFKIVCALNTVQQILSPTCQAVKQLIQRSRFA